MKEPLLVNTMSTDLELTTTKEDIMPAVTRVTDNNTGHDLCPPVPLSQGSPNVFANGLAAGRVGDPYQPHGCIVHSAHSDQINSGSPTVFVNGIPWGRVGDSVILGGSVAQGSPNVFSN